MQLDVERGAMRRREFTRLALTGAVGTYAVPTAVKAQTASDCKVTNQTKMMKRIVVDHCCGVLIDVQESFLSQLDGQVRSKIIRNTTHFARLLGHFKIPIVITLEKSVDQKGSLPQEVKEHLSDPTQTFEKNFYDLTREKPIGAHIAGLKKKQVLIAGCETDVCVLQSCLGLLNLGYEVYVVENLLFSSSHNVDATIARMKDEGAIFLTYKSLFYELTEAVEIEQTIDPNGPITKDLPN
jgi:nicotinamidase-related amidase